MSAASSHAARSVRIIRDDPSPDLLPHWSDVAPRRTPPVDAPPRVPPSPKVGAILIDLLSWAADLGIALTDECPEDRAAIEQVRDYACAWLTGEPCGDVPIADVLTTAATLLSAIDLGVRRSGRGSASDRDHRNTHRRATRAAAALVAA